MAHTLVAMFDDDVTARCAQTALTAAGFRDTQIYREQAGRSACRVALASTLCVLTLLLVDELDLVRAAHILERYTPDAIDAAMAERFLALDPDNFGEFT